MCFIGKGDLILGLYEIFVILEDGDTGKKLDLGVELFYRLLNLDTLF